MKTYVRIVLLAVALLVIVLAMTVFFKASEPESAIISAEKHRMTGSFDKARAAKDPIYAEDFHARIMFLDHQQAIAYNKENKPDSAIPVLQRLIEDEHEAAKVRPVRGSRSLLREADYYATLQISYGLKQDLAAVERANERRTMLLAAAEQAKRRERLEEGKSMGLKGE